MQDDRVEPIQQQEVVVRADNVQEVRAEPRITPAAVEPVMEELIAAEPEDEPTPEPSMELIENAPAGTQEEDFEGKNCFHVVADRASLEGIQTLRPVQVCKFVSFKLLRT